MLSSKENLDVLFHNSNTTTVLLQDLNMNTLTFSRGNSIDIGCSPVDEFDVNSLENISPSLSIISNTLQCGSFNVKCEPDDDKSTIEFVSQPTSTLSSAQYLHSSPVSYQQCSFVPSQIEDNMTYVSLTPQIRQQCFKPETNSNTPNMIQFCSSNVPIKYELNEINESVCQSIASQQYSHLSSASKQKISSVSQTQQQCSKSDTDNIHLLDLLLNENNPDNYDCLLNEFYQSTTNVKIDAPVSQTNLSCSKVQTDEEFESNLVEYSKSKCRTTSKTSQESDRARRERCNAASRKSRSNKKAYFKNSEALVEQLIAENQKLSIILDELSDAVSKSKETLVKHMSNKRK